MDPATITAFASAAGTASDILGGIFGGGLSERKQMALQAQYNREVMQNQLQWRATDAEKAGISKVFAMGAPATSFAPSSNFTGGDKFFSAASSAGHGIARAAEAYSDSKQRKVLFDQESRMNELKIKNAEIANATAASDLALRSSAKTIPVNDSRDMLIDGQGDVLKKPSEYTSSRSGNHSMEAARPAPAVKEFINADGSISRWPSKDAKASIEDSMYEWEHMYRNRFVPFWKGQGRAIRHAWDNTWWNPSYR